MPGPKCPFQTPIITGDFGCRLAQSVTVRNTPQIHCVSEEALERCRGVYDRLKTVGLAALDLPDDLVTTPHSAYLKVQCGGLLGLQAQMGGAGASGVIDDIDGLLSRAWQQDWDEFPWDSVVPHITGYRAKRRRERRT